MKNLLINFFKYAVKKRFVKENPMMDVVIKKRAGSGDDENKGLRPYIRNQVFKLVSDIAIIEANWQHILIRGAATAGADSFRVEAHKFGRKKFSVKQALNRIVEFDDSGNVISKSEIVGTTKTPNSIRTLAIADIVEDVLVERNSYYQ